MKRFSLFFLFILLTNTVFAQKTPPDTLIINTKQGQVILVSDSLKKLGALKVDDLIKKALFVMKDSLAVQVRPNSHRDSLYTKKIKNRPLRLLPVFGAGMLRDKFSPLMGLSIDFAPQRQDYYFKQGGEYTFINIAATAFFTFKAQPGKGYQTQNNIFLEGTLGNRINNAIPNNGNFSELSAGIGYLIHQEGDYLTKHSMKVFVNIGFKNSFIKIRPELYITDQFKNAFPGLALKLFW